MLSPIGTKLFPRLRLEKEAPAGQQWRSMWVLGFTSGFLPEADQGTEVLSPDLPPAETLIRLRRKTISFLQHLVRKTALNA